MSVQNDETQEDLHVDEEDQQLIDLVLQGDTVAPNKVLTEQGSSDDHSPIEQDNIQCEITDPTDVKALAIEHLEIVTKSVEPSTPISPTSTISPIPDEGSSVTNDSEDKSISADDSVSPRHLVRRRSSFKHPDDAETGHERRRIERRPSPR